MTSTVVPFCVVRYQESHSFRFWFKRPIVETGSYIEIPEAKVRRQVETLLIKFLKSNAVLNKQNVER